VPPRGIIKVLYRFLWKGAVDALADCLVQRNGDRNSVP
jgi:hypothetical protein